jgi:F-type H+-transporting ATPase subunit b
LNSSRIRLVLVLVLCCGGALAKPAPAAWALQAAEPTAAVEASKATPQANEPKGEAGEEESSENTFRHSAAVRMIGGWLHLDQESAARLFEYLNFAVLAGAVLFFLLKNLPKTFRSNRERIQHQLLDARTATEQAKERMAAIEQRLAHLDQEIAAISKQAEKDSVEDEARIKASIEAERLRIVDAATKDIAAAGSAAQRDLKRFVAGLAVDRAAQRLQLTEDDDRSLMQEFSQSLGQQGQNRGNN